MRIETGRDDALLLDEGPEAISPEAGVQLLEGSRAPAAGSLPTGEPTAVELLRRYRLLEDDAGGGGGDSDTTAANQSLHDDSQRPSGAE